jgi:hypothetical protein
MMEVCITCDTKEMDTSLDWMDKQLPLCLQSHVLRHEYKDTAATKP